MKRLLSIGAVLVFTTIVVGRAKEPSVAASSEHAGHRATVSVRVVLANGASQIATMAGAGCTQEMCSRVYISTRSTAGQPVQTRFDSLASISQISGSDALFVFRDGTTKRLSFVPGWRVFYLNQDNGRTEKLDVANIRSIEFFPADR